MYTLCRKDAVDVNGTKLYFRLFSYPTVSAWELSFLSSEFICTVHVCIYSVLIWQQGQGNTTGSYKASSAKWDAGCNWCCSNRVLGWEHKQLMKHCHFHHSVFSLSGWSGYISSCWPYANPVTKGHQVQVYGWCWVYRNEYSYGRLMFHLFICLIVTSWMFQRWMVLWFTKATWSQVSKYATTVCKTMISGRHSILLQCIAF